MASSVSAPAIVPQATKRTHAEMSSSEVSDPQAVQSSIPSNTPANITQSPESQSLELKAPENAAPKVLNSENNIANTSTDPVMKVTQMPGVVPPPNKTETAKPTSGPSCDASVTSTSEIPSVTPKPSAAVKPFIVETKISDGPSTDKAMVLDTSIIKETKIAPEEKSQVPASIALAPSSQPAAVPNTAVANGTVNSSMEPSEPVVSTNQTTGKSESQPAATQEPKPTTSNNVSNTKPNLSKSHLEEGEEPEKKPKLASVTTLAKTTGKTPEQILEYMDKTFDQRRKIITKQMPTIPELKELYPDLFMGKQLLIEFQRITKIDIDQKIQEFCVRYATAVIEMARNKKGAAPVLARWEQAKQENDTLKQYWDMVTALCLLPLHFGENFVEMVLEIGEDEEVVAQGKIVPQLVARGNIFRTDEFFLIAENTVVQEFEEFTIAFASLYSSYWVFNMVYPETIENTYNYIQRCIVRQREPGSIPAVCKNFTRALQKWNKAKEGK